MKITNLYISDKDIAASHYGGRRLICHGLICQSGFHAKTPSPESFPTIDDLKNGQPELPAVSADDLNGNDTQSKTVTAYDIAKNLNLIEAIHNDIHRMEHCHLQYDRELLAKFWLRGGRR